MTDLVKVRHKESGNVFFVDRINLNDTVEEVDDDVPTTEPEPTPGPDIVQVRVKDSGAVISIDRVNLNESVELIEPGDTPAGTPSESWTRDQLDDYAVQNGVDVTGAKTKADVLSAIQNSDGDQPPVNHEETNQ